MAFLIRTIELTSAGREIVRERLAEKTSLSIGRASENDIHLPDLAVEQRHILLKQVGERIKVEAIGTLGFAIDGRSAMSGEIDPSQGGEVILGSSLLAIAKDESGSVGISIRPAPADEGDSDQLRRFGLDSALPSKRVMSWGFALVVLFAMLTVPIVSHLTRERSAPDADGPDGVLLDANWSSGPLSLAHHSLEDNCEACHVDAFVSVRDATCLTCHEDLADHADPHRLADGRAPLSWGDAVQWSIAETFGKEGPGACTTCHSEHEGAGRMEPASQQFCADCHDTLDVRLTDTTLGNASDFGIQHPQFHPTFYTELNQIKPVRASLDSKPEEVSGLKFPHDVHLDLQGGVAQMAIRLGAGEGYGAPLECSNCHSEDSNKVGFEPIEMEQACESCHSLVFDQVGGIYRKLRHGDVEQMWANLMAMDRTPRGPITSGRNRPGQFAEGGLYYSDFGPPNPRLSGLSGALSPDGVCGECHLPTTNNGQPDVMPVNLPDRYMLHGWFDHAAHNHEECSTCHAAETSSSERDLLLPGIAVCRDCHEGEEAASAEVPSGCAMCHSYHIPTGPAPLNHPKTNGEIIASISRWERRGSMGD